MQFNFLIKLFLILLFIGVHLTLGMVPLFSETTIFLDNVLNTGMYLLIIYSVVVILNILIENWGRKWTEKNSF